jgi:hypothetical protein
LKRPKSWHIASAISDALEELKAGVEQVLSMSSDNVSTIEWIREEEEHQDMITLPKGTAHIYYRCVHLCANSINERTLLVKIVC